MENDNKTIKQLTEIFMHSMHLLCTHIYITCPITLTYSELNNYSVLNDRAHLQKKLNEQKETGMK